MVATAKNEAAYLAEWVHHHLYFGFDPIELHVNRSDDRTEEIARKIAAVEPRLTVYNADALDRARGFRGSIQHAVYDAALPRMRALLRRNDYLCVLDIDEFWTPLDFESSVTKVLCEAGWPRFAGFSWFLRINDEPPFGPAFPAQLDLRSHRMVKTAFSLDLKVTKMVAHGPVLAKKEPMWSASKTTPRPENVFKTQEPAQTLGPAFILHRFFRSQVEYLAILGRLRPKQNGKLFKDNRLGYQYLIQRSLACSYMPPEQALSNYERSLADFLTKTGAQSNRAEDIRMVRARATAVLQSYLPLPKEERRVWKRQFSGLDIPSLAEELGLLSSD